MKLSHSLLFILHVGLASFSYSQDTDNDLVTDFFDLDTDNDGILDQDEKYCDNALVANSISGVGAFQDQVYLFDWTSPMFVDGIQNGDYQMFILPDGSTITATFSSVTGIGNLFPTDMPWTWQLIGGAYNSSGIKENLFTSPSPSTDIHFTITFVGVNTAGQNFLLDLFAMETETLATNHAKEEISWVTNGQPWSVFESYSGGGVFVQPTADSLVCINTLGTGNSIYCSRNANVLSVNVVALNGNQEGIVLGFRVPCDTDQDGVYNYMDLDSDNDLCNDASEAYFDDSFDSNQDGTFGGVVTSSDVDTDGLVIGAGYPGSNSDVLNFGGVACPSFLPIELTSFLGNCGYNGVSLEWTTNSEVNSDFFRLDYSLNGNDWTTINQQNASGFSNEVRNYNYFHLTHQSEPLYYRLSQFDYDGASKVYPIISVNCTSSNELSVHVNNEQKQITIYNREELHYDFGNIEVIDYLGREVLNYNVVFDKDKIIIDYSNTQIQSGYYFIRITANNEKLYLSKNLF